MFIYLGISCPALPPIANGTLTPSFCAIIGNYFGDSCHYTCNQGYQLNGNTTRTCQADGQWDDAAIPKCDKGNFCTA